MRVAEHSGKISAPVIERRFDSQRFEPLVQFERVFQFELRQYQHPFTLAETRHCHAPPSVAVHDFQQLRRAGIGVRQENIHRQIVAHVREPHGLITGTGDGMKRMFHRSIRVEWVQPFALEAGKVLFSCWKSITVNRKWESSIVYHCQPR